MTDEAARAGGHRTGRPMAVTTVDWDRVERALPDPGVREALARLGVGVGGRRPAGRAGADAGRARPVQPARSGARSARPRSRPRSRSAAGPGWRCTTPGSSASSATSPTRCSAACSPTPPEPNHSQIVVRYVPAAAGAEIGGDWYDAFLQPDGATVLAIGDVVGHDTRAAAAMGQVRGLLRGIGYSSGGSPAEVLTELDRAIEGLALDTMATALVARLEQDEDDLRAGQVAAALVQRRAPAAGRARPPTARRRCWTTTPADLLLGVAPDTPRRGARRPSSTRARRVLLYTDGLVERRDRDLDAGTAELVGVLARVRRPAAGRAVRRVLERLFLPDAAGRRRHARRPAAPAGRAAAGGGRSAGGAGEHRARARRPPRGRRRRLSVRAARPAAAEPVARARGRSTATGASQPRHTDSTRSAGDQHDDRRRRPAAGPARAGRRAR